MICHFGEHSPTTIAGVPIGPDPTVTVDDPAALHEPLSLADARALAIALLEAADWAEFCEDYFR